MGRWTNDDAYLIISEYDVIEQLVKKEAKEQEAEVLEMYTMGANAPFAYNIARYYYMQGIEDIEQLVSLVITQLDKYDVLYSTRWVTDLVEKYAKTHLKKEDERITIYKSEVRTISELDDCHARRLAFGLLCKLKLNKIKYGKQSIHNSEKEIGRVNMLFNSKGKDVDEIYLCLHEMIISGMITIPISLDNEDRITINFLSSGEDDEIAYTLSNTDMLRLSSVYDKLFEGFGKATLEVSIKDDYYFIHKSIAEATRRHNERCNDRLNESRVTECRNHTRALAGDTIFLPFDCWGCDEDFVKKVVEFAKKDYRKAHRLIKKKKGSWVISQHFIGAIDDVGEVVYEYIA